MPEHPFPAQGDSRDSTRCGATTRTIRDTAGLVGAGLLAPARQAALDQVTARYAVAVTPAVRRLIEGPDDPIGRQFVPSQEELATAPHELGDPIGDAAHSPVPGVVHRYPDRALLRPLLVCPVYCRFCFRREEVGPGGGVLTDAELEAAYAYLRGQPAIREVILTGGDPLMLSPRRLRGILSALAAIPHVELLRIHSRVPCVDPGRVTVAMAEALDAAKPVWLVLHANHARELGPDAEAALRRLSRSGVPLLGQTVLLRGVNDGAQTLEALFRRMLACRVKPYYLHQLDPAPGTARFHVPLAEGRRILGELRGRVTGLAWPTYVVDIPGGYGKVPVAPDYLLPGGVAGHDAVRDPHGGVHVLAAPPPPG